MRRVPPGLLGALPVHALGALGIVVVVRDVGPRQVVLVKFRVYHWARCGKFTHLNFVTA